MSHARPSFDPRSFRNALGSFATGVTVVTTRGLDGEPIGVTVNSFNSVSLDPPMILWSLARSSRSLAAFEAAEHWAVHILASDQEPLSNRFARSGQEKFAGIDVEPGLGQAPLLGGCASRLQCKAAFRYEGGDHVIFVGEVVDFDHANVAPLIFHGGKYALATRKAEPSLLSGSGPRESDISTGEDFLGYLLWRASLHFENLAQAHLQAQNLDVDSFMVLAMLLHHDGRTLEQLSAGLLQAAPDTAKRCTAALAQRDLVRMGGDQVWLTDTGRAVTLQIHAASKSIESDLLERMDEVDGIALKHLLRQFIARTDSGLPHPWQTVAPSLT